MTPTWVSPNITAILGYTPEEVPEPGCWRDHPHLEDREKALKAIDKIRAKGHVVHEYRFRKKDGDYIWVRNELQVVADAHGNPVEIVGAWLDVTEPKQIEKERQGLEEQFRQTQKMEAIGTLAGGVAHDLRFT